MVGIFHILRAWNDEVFVVAEPDTVKYERVEPVHHHPQGIGRQSPTHKSVTSVDIADKQSEQHPEHRHGDNFLGVEHRSAEEVACVDKTKLVTPLDD